MKKAKKILALVMVLVMVVVCCPIAMAGEPEVTTPVEPDNVTRMGNASTCGFGFTISSTGKASLSASYFGFNGITTGATVYSYIERKSGSTWIRVSNGQNYNQWVDNLSGVSNMASHTLQLTQTGEYRACFKVYIYGSNPTDTVTDTKYDTY